MSSARHELMSSNGQAFFFRVSKWVESNQHEENQYWEYECIYIYIMVSSCYFIFPIMYIHTYFIYTHINMYLYIYILGKKTTHELMNVSECF